MNQTALKDTADILSRIKNQTEIREKFGKKTIHHKDISTFDEVFQSFTFDTNAKLPQVASNVGTFCTVSVPGQRFSLRVIPSDAIKTTVTESMLKLDNDTIYFKIIGYDDGTALVTADYNIILGDRWLAVIDASTIPSQEEEKAPTLHLVEKKMKDEKTPQPVLTVDQDVLVILSRMEVEANLVKLTCGQLDRGMYTKVNKVLELLGGKWNKKAGGHIFKEDPSEQLESVLLTGTIAKPEKYGFFPTQPELAKAVIDLAWLEEGMKVFEPSAGIGGLADFIAPIIGVENLYCAELQKGNVVILREKGYKVTEGDFMAIPIPTPPTFERLVMNPPFERQQDIDHVLHAWEFLKPGGRLVAIMASSVKFRENKKTADFREFVEINSGKILDNPEGSFKASGTGVNTVTVVIDKGMA